MIMSPTADVQLENDTQASWKKQKTSGWLRESVTSTNVRGRAVQHNTRSTTVRLIMNGFPSAVLPEKICTHSKK